VDTSRSANGPPSNASVPEPLRSVIDHQSFAAAEDDLATTDPLGFPGYPEAAAKAREKTANDESVVAGRATIGGHHVEVAGFDFAFLGGSMGRVAGERMERAMSRAARRRVPFVLVTSTGGARMQEGMLALVQMAKVTIARRELSEANEPFIAVLGNPTTGGVLASVASLADVTIAESNATIGFAGPRVAEAITGEPLPDDSHTAESALANGAIDEICPRSHLRERVTEILEVLVPSPPAAVEAPSEIGAEGAPAEPDAWEVVQGARRSGRPSAPELLQKASEAAVLLRGDRSGGEDPGVRAALVTLAGRRAVALATDRASLPGPAAYRKAIRAIHTATRLDLPVVTLIDMPGADPSARSEAGGIAAAIAGLFDALLAAPVPTVSLVTGEGGSGGALAFAVTDRLIAWDDSFFSVIGPESAATILWRDAKRASEAATALRLTAADLKRLGIADYIVTGPLDATSVKNVLAYHLDAVSTKVPDEERLEARWERWRRKGEED
jgi:acetyl-CoA carboxylase carboxyl transferase subunit beta